MSRYDRSSRRASARRNRRNRLANSSVPGYDNLGWDHFGHPASSDQPELEEYGLDSDFGEGVHQGPYPQSPAPASQGWEPDHPASKENLKSAMERKAQKCILIAESRLGKRASRQEIEDLALQMMDLPNRAINSRVARLSEEHDAGLAQFGRGAEEHDAGYMAEEHDAGLAQFGRGAEMHDAGYMADDDEIIDDIGLMAEMTKKHIPVATKDRPSAITGDPRGQGVHSGGASKSDHAAYMSAWRDYHGKNADEEMFADEEMGMGETLAEMSLAEQLAEEIGALKMANARLARQLRKLAGEEKAEEAEEAPEEAPEEAEEKAEETSKKASEMRLARIERLADALSAYMAEAKEEKAEATMANLLAELEGDEAVVAEEAVMAEEEMGSDVMGLDAPSMASIDPRLASIFTASEEEESEDEEDEEEAPEEAEEKASSKKAKKSEDEESEDEESEDEESEDEDEEDEDEEEASEDEASSKKASYRPRRTARQASVKTLGNISREASTSDELSKLWESAPDVSKFFG